MLTSEIQTVQIYMTKTKAIFLSPLIWHTDHLPPELSPHIQGGKPCKSVSREKGLETIPHGNCLLRMCKYEYACHINRITPKWSNSFIIKTAHCRPVAYRTLTEMWCFFNSLYLFALSLCVVNSPPMWFFFAAMHMKSHTSLHMVLWTLLALRSWNALQTHIQLYIYISEETYDNHKRFLAWPQHNLQPVVRLPVSQRTRLMLSVIVPLIPVRVWAAALPVVQKLRDALHQQMCIYPKQCKQYMQQQWCFATSMSPLHTTPCQLLAKTYVKKLYKSKT